MRNRPWALCGPCLRRGGAPAPSSSRCLCCFEAVISDGPCALAKSQSGSARRHPSPHNRGRQPRGIQRFNRLLVEAIAGHLAVTGRALSVVSLGDARSDSSAVAGVISSNSGGSRRRFIVSAIREARRSRPTTIIAGLVHFAPLALGIKWLGFTDQYAVQLYGTEAWKRVSTHRRLALRKSVMLISITEATASMAAEANDLHAASVRVLSPVVEETWLTTPPRPGAPIQPSSAFRLLTVARLDAAEGKKGIDDVLHALASPAFRTAEVEYVVVGDGTDRARLEALAGDLGLSRRVRFLGALASDELRAEYLQCDLFVMPSTQEGFGIVFLEAMACRKPVLASRFGGVPEVVVDGETGLLVEPGDRAGLVQGLRALLDDPALRRRLGEAGRHRVESRFTKRQFQITLEAILSELYKPLHSARHQAGPNR